jgi:hypothetical protein
MLARRRREVERRPIRAPIHGVVVSLEATQ